MEVKITKDRISVANKEIVADIGFIPFSGSKIVSARVAAGRKYKITENDKDSYLTKLIVTYHQEILKSKVEHEFKCCFFFKWKTTKMEYPIEDACNVFNQANINFVVKFINFAPIIEYTQKFFGYVSDDEIKLLSFQEYAKEKEKILRKLKEQNER
jgi:hypothetical protein